MRKQSYYQVIVAFVPTVGCLGGFRFPERKEHGNVTILGDLKAKNIQNGSVHSIILGR